MAEPTYRELRKRLDETLERAIAAYAEDHPLEALREYHAASVAIRDIGELLAAEIANRVFLRRLGDARRG